MEEGVGDEYKESITITELEENIDVITSEKNSLQKENKRLSGLLKTSENRMKGTLQDQMLLSQHLHLAQDEQSGSKTFIAQLLQDLEYERSSKDSVEELHRHINDLQHEFDKAQSELRESKADRKLLVNLKLDLQHAENQVEALENNLSEGTIELERGAIAIEQLDNYREQLREKTKENREMRLRLQCLDKELNDNSYIKTQYKQSEEELREYKIKLEKVPNLITEIARLRGSSKASVKALSEQVFIY
jgi:chromosome segregation ATPase